MIALAVVVDVDLVQFDLVALGSLFDSHLVFCSEIIADPAVAVAAVELVLKGPFGQVVEAVLRL